MHPQPFQKSPKVGIVVQLEVGSNQWQEAWHSLAATIRRKGWGDGTDLVQPGGSGHCWQYIRTEIADGRVRHLFSHRSHKLAPATVWVRHFSKRGAELIESLKVLVK